LADVTKEDSSEFLVRHEKLDLRIYLSSSNLLLPHEETIPSRVSELEVSFRRDGVVRDPIIVDASSRVVLDGMHRLAALRQLRCFCVPVCAVDYLNPSIRVGVWYRTLSGRLSSDQFENALSSSDVEFERVPLDTTDIIGSPQPAVLFASGESLRFRSRGLQVYHVLKTMERCARVYDLTVAYETEHDALEKLMNKKVDAVITLPKIDKTSVREAGLAGRLLPHKVTRHIIPARPLRVNVLLMTLTDGTMPLQETNRQLFASLRTRGITRRPSGTVIEGRRYDEEIFVFN